MTWHDVVVVFVLTVCVAPALLFIPCLVVFLAREQVRDHRARKARAAARRVWRADGRVL